MDVVNHNKQPQLHTCLVQILVVVVVVVVDGGSVFQFGIFHGWMF